MVGDVLVPELNGIYFAAVAARPELALENRVGTRRSTRRKDRPVARLKGGHGTANLDKVDCPPLINRSLAQHIASVGREDAVDGLYVVHPTAIDVHIAVIGHGIVALEPQLNGVHVELALFEVLDPPRARRILGRIGIPEGNGYRLPGFHIELHFLPAFAGDLVLVGIGSGNRRGRARYLAGRVVGLHAVDVQVMEGFVFRCIKRNFAIDGVAEVIVVPGFVAGNRAARVAVVTFIVGAIVSSGIRQCRANIKNLIARESIRAACRATRKGQRQPHVIANRLKVSRHIGHRCVLDFSQSARNSIGPVVLGFDKFAERLIRHAALNIGKIIGIRLALFECDIARKHAVRVVGNHGRIDPNAALACHIGHATGHDGVACRSGGVVAESVLFSGCRIVRRCR